MAALRTGFALLAAAYVAGAPATLAGIGDRSLIGSLLFVPLAAAALSLCERDTRKLVKALLPAFLILVGASIALLVLALFFLDTARPVSNILAIPMEGVGYLVPSGHDFAVPAFVWILSMALLVLGATGLLAIVRALRPGPASDGSR